MFLQDDGGDKFIVWSQMKYVKLWQIVLIDTEFKLIDQN